MASCRPAPSESISSMKKRTGLRAAACANTPWIFSAVAPIQRLSNFGAETYSKFKPEFACSRSCQEGLAGSARPVQQNPVSYQAVAFVFSRFQMALHHLADLLLRIFHAANVGKPLGWHIANHLLPLYLRPRCWSARRQREPLVAFAWALDRKIQKNETTQPIGVNPQKQNPQAVSAGFFLLGCLQYWVPHQQESASQAQSGWPPRTSTGFFRIAGAFRRGPRKRLINTTAASHSTGVLRNHS